MKQFSLLLSFPLLLLLSNCTALPDIPPSEIEKLGWQCKYGSDSDKDVTMQAKAIQENEDIWDNCAQELIKSSRKMSKDELREKLTYLHQEYFQSEAKRIRVEIKAKNDEARKQFLYDLLRLKGEGAKLNTSSISNPYDIENCIKKMALDDMKKGNFNLLLPLGIEYDEENRNKELKNRYGINVYGVIFTKSPYGSKETQKLYEIYNSTVMDVLEKKLGKGFLNNNRKKK